MADKNTAPVKVMTSTQMAKDLGIDRSTLVRLEQRLVLPKAPFAPPNSPVQGRIYDAALATRVRAAYAKHCEKALAEREARPKPPSNFIVVDRLS